MSDLQHELDRILSNHRAGRDRAGIGWACLCGWTGPYGSYHRAHVAAALEPFVLGELHAQRALTAEILAEFREKGHPGGPCLRTGWINEKTVAEWRERNRGGGS